MNRTTRELLVFAIVLALGATTLSAVEQRSARQARPSYSHDRAERAAAPEPEHRALPGSLRIAVPRDEVASPAADSRREAAAVTRSGVAAPDRFGEIHSRAREAAAWAAQEVIDRYGRARYFEIGFHQGVRDAFRRAQRDRWEFDQGRRSGRFDPEALGLGEQIGTDDAQRASAEDAHRRVVAQFADLTREPWRLAPPPPPPFTASGFTVDEPELRQVFHDLAWRGHRDVGFADPRLDPWRLYRAGRHEEFYDGDWRTVRRGLDLWRQGRRNSGWMRDLAGDERRLFEESFGIVFEAELARRFSRVADRAFDRGFDSGWRHGIRIGREWQYRRGYHLGFEDGVRDAARAAFDDRFRPAWAAAYGDLFREWSTTVKLEIRSARLWDGNDDGIFEPGEELFAELELVNVGGGAGRVDLTLAGDLLAGRERQEIDLPRRSVVPRIEPLRAVILPAAPAATSTVVTVSIGELRERLPLRVSHVLRFEDGFQLAAHDALRGTAVVDVRLANASRRPAFASLDAGLQRGTVRRPHRELPEIPAGASHRVSFEIQDVHPLDLIAGDLTLSVASATGGRAQDRLEARLPILATDLGDHSLVDYLLWLGRSSAKDPAELRRAHELMLRRLEADWQAAVRGKGNPYKTDLRGGGASTALGELVAAARASRGRSVDRAVLADLVPRIEELSRSLPGAHPFMRRSMRKLGRQLL